MLIYIPERMRMDAASDVTGQVQHLLQRLAADGEPEAARIVTFIAARPREGTSTVARHYAQAASQARHKVLLIDAGAISKRHFQALGVEPSTGMIDHMLSGKAPQDVIYASPEGFSVCRWIGSEANRSRCGKIAYDAALWQSLRASFDTVVIDAPSLQSAFDGVMLACKSDAAVIVTEAEKTPRPVVLHLRDTLAGSGAQLAGAVLNKRRFHIPSRIYKRL